MPMPLLRILLVTRFERRHPRRVLRRMSAVGRLMHSRLVRGRMMGRAPLVSLLELRIELLMRQRGLAGRLKMHPLRRLRRSAARLARPFAQIVALRRARARKGQGVVADDDRSSERHPGAGSAKQVASLQYCTKCPRMPL